MESAFLDHLKLSGLLSDEQVATVSGKFANSAIEVVVSGLVEQGLLTPFQVKQLHAGQPKGLVLGQYHLLDELGRGGYGCVYKARHKLMNRIVALKVIAPERVEDSRARAWFRREVLATTQLTHPNIALAYDADEIDGILFFAMEYIDGLNLDALVRQRGPVPIGTACEMLLQTAKALQYAHEKGMVHRDIKPANLLIPRGTIAEAASDFAPQTYTGTARPVLVKVVDFGLARLQNSSSNNTLVLQSERSFVGTPAYVSPEQARNVHEVDIRSDLYSLGCTFYHALAGRAPFQASTPLQIVVQHLEKEPEPIERLRPEIPSALASIIRRLMAKKPDKRFQTPGELLGELGFFYALDRSGVQRSIPFALSERIRSLKAEPSIIADTRVSESPAVHSADESQNIPTRIVSWDAVAGSAPEQTTPPEQSIVMPQTVLLSLEAAGATTTCNAREVAAPALPEPQALNDRQTRVVDRDLMRTWQQWGSVLDDLSAGRSPGLDDASYRALHRHLIEACNAQAARADQARAAVLRQIAELVQPWLTLATLGEIDHETLASLRGQRNAIRARLGDVGHGWWKWLVGTLLLVLTAGAGYFLLPTIGNFRNVSAASWAQWIQRNPLLSLTILVPAVLIIFVVLMNKLLRAPRS